MEKLNCWEFMGCGREPGGDNVEEYGLCPTAINISLNGLHDGINGGRACWIAAGTFSENKQCINIENIGSCVSCEFYKLVMQQKLVDSEEIKKVYGEIIYNISIK